MEQPRARVLMGLASPAQLALYQFGLRVLVLEPGLDLKFDPFNIWTRLGLSDRKSEAWTSSYS